MPYFPLVVVLCSASYRDVVTYFIAHFWQHQLPATVFLLEIFANVPICKPIRRADVKRNNEGNSFYCAERVVFRSSLRFLPFTLPGFMERPVRAEGWKGETATKYRTFPISSTHFWSCESTEISKLQVPF